MERKAKRAFIRAGASVGQDHRVWTWPALSGKVCEPVNVIFDCQPTGNGWVCRSHGYGLLRCPTCKHSYGNGAVYVRYAKDLRPTKRAMPLCPNVP